MIYIPILDTIQHLLQNETVLSEVYYTVCRLHVTIGCMHMYTCMVTIIVRAHNYHID